MGASVSNKIAFGMMIERQNWRLLRARQLAHAAINKLDQFIPEDAQRSAMDALLALFMEEGVEVLTDHTRSEAGLPERDEKGWTFEEIQALERVRIEVMLRPIPQFIVNRDGTITDAKEGTRDAQS